MKITILMNAINLILGRLLIMGLDIRIGEFFVFQTPAFGVQGSAYALIFARLSGLVLASLFVVYKSKTIRINSLHFFKPDFKVQKTILSFGIPTSVESFLFQLGRMTTQIFIVSMGTASIFAFSVTSNILGFINVPGNALATGVMILVGQKIGRGETDDVKKTIKFATLLSSFVFLFVCLLGFPLVPFINNIYNATPEAAVFIKQSLYFGFAMSPIFWSISFVMPAGLRATGDVTYTMVVAIFSMFAFRIVIGYVLGIIFNIGVLGIWIGMIVDWFVRGALFYYRVDKEKFFGHKSV